jgi:hypothetical protein
MSTFRWITVLPGAVVLGYLAYFVGGFVNNVTTTMLLRAPLEGWLLVATDAVAHMYMGAAFVYSAIKIAPAASTLVARGAFGILVAFASWSMWSAYAIGKYYAVPAISGLLFGGLAVLIAAAAGEIGPYRRAGS